MAIIEVDHSFIKSIPFFVKLAELLCCIIIWICVGSIVGFPYSGHGGFVNFSATWSFIITLLLFIFYLLKIIQKLPGPWVLIEVCSIGLSMVLFLISTIVAGVLILHNNGIIATVFFTIVAIVIYAVEFFLRFRIMRSEGAHFAIQSTTSTTENPPQNQFDNAGQAYVIGA